MNKEEVPFTEEPFGVWINRDRCAKGSSTTTLLGSSGVRQRDRAETREYPELWSWNSGTRIRNRFGSARPSAAFSRRELETRARVGVIAKL